MGNHATHVVKRNYSIVMSGYLVTRDKNVFFHTLIEISKNIN
jgi:hypothetical protein